ncbi:MAG: hypothetical protein JSS86_04515 [Cyanobacteria bacterium SZAS LIN-2]|nr:hypothetical protein [Cyanobacteria bacterium SZAS LIN-2]
MTTDQGESRDNSMRDQRIKSMEGPANTARELAKKLSYFTYYELLFLDDDATTEEIHRAYIKRTTEIRSRFRTGRFSHEWRLTEFIRALHEAHTVLTSAELRKEYDARLAAGDWQGGFCELLAQAPGLREQASWSAAQKSELTIKDLLIDAGYASELEIESILEMHPGVKDGPELAQLLADGGLISFEELATVLLGKALIDRRQITVEQFKKAAGDMRNHSYKFVDALVDQGWLTAAELSLIGID